MSVVFTPLSLFLVTPFRNAGFGEELFIAVMLGSHAALVGLARLRRCPLPELAPSATVEGTGGAGTADPGPSRAGSTHGILHRFSRLQEKAP